MKTAVILIFVNADIDKYSILHVLVGGGTRYAGLEWLSSSEEVLGAFVLCWPWLERMDWLRSRLMVVV